MTRTPYMLRYLTGLQPVTANSSAYLQPDGHYGLNNAAVFWTPEGAVLVDTAFDVPRAKTIVDAITHSSRKPSTIAALMLTHDHGDHSYGACAVPTQRVIMSHTSAAALVEGYARDYLYVNGAWRDHVLTSLTNHDWKPLD